MPLRLAILLLAIATAHANPNRVVEAARRDTPPAIDADFSDWPDALWLDLAPVPPHAARGYSRLRDDGHEGFAIAETAADLSARFTLAWSDTALYLAADVTDNVHDVDGGNNRQWFFKDAVTLFLDLPLDGDGPGWIEGDHAFAFVADPTYPHGSMWWRRGERAGHRETPAPPGTRMAVVRTDKGYALEALVPVAPLTAITPFWAPPLATRTVGFALVVTDPDGGERPFGGQLIYGAAHDDDGGWTRLRLRDATLVSAPYMDVSAEEIDFEARLRADLERIRPFFAVGPQSQIDSTGLQNRLAAEYFQLYLNKRPQRFAHRALENAFMLWGNAGAADEVRRAIDQIDPGEDVWDKITGGVRQAYYKQHRLDEGMALLAALEPRVIPLRSRSALLYTLSQYWLGQNQRTRARRALEQIATWRASPWHAGQARHQLWRMDQNPDLTPDQL